MLGFESEQQLRFWCFHFVVHFTVDKEELAAVLLALWQYCKARLARLHAA